MRIPKILSQLLKGKRLFNHNYSMQKIILIIGVALISYGATAQKGINWMSMDKALAAQKLNPKKIFMDVYTNWCGACKQMDKKTFSNKKVIRYINKNFYPVKFNAEGTESVTYKDFTYTNPNYREGFTKNTTHFFADALKLQGYPSIVFFEEDGNIIQAVPGYKTPKELELYLKMVATNDYKKVNTASSWKKYQENFKSTF
ncbi:MAG: thioredoxin-related protein [Patiriisocius sp.]|jgi:thioredoxin-related protein